MSYPIPTSFPSDEISTVLAAVRDPAHAVTVANFWAASVILAYGWNALGQPSEPPLMTGTAECDEKKLEAELVKLQGVRGDAADVGGPVLDILLPLLKAWLLKWLSK
jgi:hypothetical protein